MNEKGFESRTTNVLASRGVTLEQHETKMKNLSAVSRGGKKIKMLAHDRYLVEGVKGTYNPYTNTLSGSKVWHP